MNSFFYFVRDWDMAFFRRYGLDDRIDCDCARQEANVEAEDGWVVTRGTLPARHITWSPWYQIDGADAFRIGTRAGETPTPEDLKRPRQLRGTFVELGDGNQWLIPAARLAPAAMTLNNGHVTYDPLDVHEVLWADVQRISDHYQAILMEQTTTLTDVEILNICARALAANYRVSADPSQEVSILKLITTDNYEEVFAALMDLERIKQLSESEAEKKTVSTG